MAIDFLLDFLTPGEIIKQTGAKVRMIRMRRKITQEELAKKSGVSLSSLKRFEHTREISYLSLAKIASALEVEDELKNLFEKVPYNSIEEIINDEENT
ncbi:MAG: helix-turn-helix transcriptional regulator [Phascolarctobacterium sp.]|nr:helix-turn-helix transcriptional regulator [Phascolarctobacterium sp.]